MVLLSSERKKDLIQNQEVAIHEQIVDQMQIEQIIINFNYSYCKNMKKTLGLLSLLIL
jgi:hypothetical protein